MLMSDQRISIDDLARQRVAAKQLKAEWREGGHANAAEAIERLGGSALHKSVVLDLAYEEYCLHRETGADIDSDSFLAKFPRVARSLRRQICVHDALAARGVLGDPEDLPEWPVIGDIIAGFLLTEELGRGSFGRVFRAKEINLRERQVVVKVARHGLHEAQLLAKVAHQGVVQVYSVTTDEEWQVTVLCMPFISRATLQDVIELVHADRKNPPTKGIALRAAAQSVNCKDDTLVLHADTGAALRQLTFADAVSVFGKLAAEALEATHATGIYHRDLKPSNILVDLSGRPLLIDFNLSSEPLKDVPLGGTLPYMAPEQLQAFLDSMAGKATLVEVGAAADLFSLGVCLFELLYGVHPFAPIPMDLSNIELGSYLLERQAIGPRRISDGEHMIDSRLKQIISQCLEFDLTRRPSSASDLAYAFRNTMSLSNQIRRFVRVQPRLAKLSALSLAGTLLAGGLWLNSLPTDRQLLQRSAESAMRRGAYADAISPLNKLISSVRNDTEFLLMRGTAFLKTNRFQEGLDDLKKVYDERPTSDVAAKIAWCNIQLGYHSVAARWYQQTIEAFEETAEIHNNLGHTLARDGAYTEAVKHYTRALELKPGMTTVYLNRADALFQQSLRTGRPTPDQALQDLLLANFGRMKTTDLYILQCRICSNLETPNEAGFLNALRSCVKHKVPRSLLESDALMTKMWTIPEAKELLQQAPLSGGNFTRSVRLIPPR